MKLIAYVSDENYLALADVQAEFRNQKNDSGGVLVSSPRGAFYADLPDGNYRVTLAKDGYGAKWVDCEITSSGKPLQLRLLSDSLLGYMWPKWTRSGERSEIRAHGPEQYQL